MFSFALNPMKYEQHVWNWKISERILKNMNQVII